MAAPGEGRGEPCDYEIRCGVEGEGKGRVREVDDGVMGEEWTQVRWWWVINGHG